MEKWDRIRKRCKGKKATKKKVKLTDASEKQAHPEGGNRKMKKHTRGIKCARARKIGANGTCVAAVGAGQCFIIRHASFRVYRPCTERNNKTKHIPNHTHKHAYTHVSAEICYRPTRRSRSSIRRTSALLINAFAVCLPAFSLWNDFRSRVAPPTGYRSQVGSVSSLFSDSLPGWNFVSRPGTAREAI